MTKSSVTKNEMLQRMARRYREQFGPEAAIEGGAFADWLLKQGWRPPRQRTVKELLVRDIGRAMRSEYRKDKAGGFMYRANVAYRTTDHSTGEQFTFWIDPDFASKKQIEVSLMQRRNQILGDVQGLANDRDHFNSVRGAAEGPINMTFDFNDDVEEARALQAQMNVENDQLETDEDDKL